MARTVRVHLIDDIDGSTADETVRFSLDHITYEIDLSGEHSEQFRKTVAPYIVAGRRASRGLVTGGRSRAATSGTPAVGLRNQAIREWAKRTGIPVQERGRIAASVVERYENATVA